jgi:hypothetical protein
MKLLQRWKQTAVHNKALVLTSVLVAFGTLFYAGAASFQVWLMAQGSKHTDEQLGWVIGNVNWLARSMDLSQKTNEQGIEASGRQSQQVLQTTIDNFDLDQRAWLGITEVATPPELQQGTILDSTAYVTNTGKTPAFNLVRRAVWQIKKADDIPDPAREVSMGTPHLDGIVMPGAKRLMGICSLGAINQQRADELNSGAYRLYIFGEITYTDAFHHQHFTRFSMRMELGKTLAFAPWGNYNDAN